VSTEVSNLPIPNGKGKNVVVSMVQKYEALQTLDNVKTTQKLAEKCGVGGVTFGAWKRIKLTKLKNGIHRAVHWSPQRCSSVRRSGSDRWTRGPAELPTGDSG
jgi:hypothetical protein